MKRIETKIRAYKMAYVESMTKSRSPKIQALATEFPMGTIFVKDDGKEYQVIDWEEEGIVLADPHNTYAGMLSTKVVWDADFLRLAEKADG